jgi:hypothetical protein
LKCVAAQIIPHYVTIAVVRKGDATFDPTVGHVREVERLSSDPRKVALGIDEPDPPIGIPQHLIAAFSSDEVMVTKCPVFWQHSSDAAASLAWAQVTRTSRRAYRWPPNRSKFWQYAGVGGAVVGLAVGDREGGRVGPAVGGWDGGRVGLAVRGGFVGTARQALPGAAITIIIILPFAGCRP